MKALLKQGLGSSNIHKQMKNVRNDYSTAALIHYRAPEELFGTNNSETCSQ